MVHLTSEEISLLRQALGLSYYNRENAKRNWLAMADAEKYPQALSSLIERGYMAEDYTFGMGGKEPFYKATDAGRFAVLEQKWPAL
jgi:hypothetical protein